MRTFDDNNEIELLAGILDGLTNEWSCAQKWVTIMARRGGVEVSIRPPATKGKELYRMRELILEKLSEDNLYKAGRVVGYEMAAYLNKYRSFIDPAALD